MPLIAKTVAEGFLHGHHQSIQRGVGIEFSQYRPYEDGDDLSRIDWKLFARSDRYYVREAERESEMSVWFVVDTSASMSINSVGLQSEDKDSWNKLEFAKHLIAVLSYLANQQGDKFGLLSVSSEQCYHLPLGSNDKHWSSLLRKMLSLTPGEVFPSIEFIKHRVTQLQNPCMVFVISDFYQDNNEITEFMKKISIGHNEVFALQLTCDDEEDFSFSGAVRFEDAETKEQVLVAANKAKGIFEENLNAHRKALIAQLRKLDIELSTINIDQPMDQTIYDFLKSRARILA